MFRRQTKASFAATRRGSRRKRKSLAHLIRSRPSSEVASSSYSYHLFSIVKHKPGRSNDMPIRVGIISPEIAVLAAPAGRTLTKGRPEEPAQMRLIRKTHTQRYLTQG